MLSNNVYQTFATYAFTYVISRHNTTLEHRQREKKNNREQLTWRQLRTSYSEPPHRNETQTSTTHYKRIDVISILTSATEQTTVKRTSRRNYEFKKLLYKSKSQFLLCIFVSESRGLCHDATVSDNTNTDWKYIIW